jgi:hypothetical protein
MSLEDRLLRSRARVACAFEGDEEPAVRALEACMPGRLDDQELRAEALVTVRALDVEHVVLVRRLRHVPRVAAGAVRTGP